MGLFSFGCAPGNFAIQKFPIIGVSELMHWRIAQKVRRWGFSVVPSGGCHPKQTLRTDSLGAENRRAEKREPMM